MTRIAIVEDNITMLQHLKALLEGTEEMQVVGAYASGDEALRRLPEHTPDVMLVDLSLPDISGIDIIEKAHARFSEMEILVFTMHEDREHLFAALKAGATGYLLKGAGSLEIINAIKELIKGGAPMSPKIARYIIEDLRGNAGEAQKVLLSTRELDVLKGIAYGLSEKKLAEGLSLSVHTIHTHVKKIYRKLHVTSKTEAVLRAKSKGII